MEHTATLTFTKPLVRQGIFYYWRRTIGWFWPTLVVLLTVKCGFDWMQGESLSSMGALAGITAMSIVLLSTFLIGSYLQGMRRFEAMKNPTAWMSCTEGTIRMESDMGKVEIPWSGIKKVWVYPELWLIFYSANQFSTLPAQDLTTAMKDFIKQRVVASGGQVIT